MNLPEFTENVNIHQSLPDQPTLTPTELKIKWDEGVSKIKNYINTLLLDAIEQGVSDDLDSTKETIKNDIDTALEELETKVNETISKEISALESSVQTAIQSTQAKSMNLSLSSGVSANQKNFKVNNMVMLDSFMTISVAPGATKQIATIPQGYRPKSTITAIVPGISVDSNGTEFGLARKTVTITSAGAVSVANTTPNDLGSTTLKYLFLKTNYLV